MKIKTRQISLSDIELIRYWRNKKFVREQMLTQNLISSVNQKKWFNSLDSTINHIFIYSLNNIDIGCVVCKITDLEKKVFDIGVYCGNSEYFGHPINFLSMIFIHDFAFNVLTLETSVTTIKTNNKSSFNINKKLGYNYHKNYNKDFDYYILKKSEYIENKQKLIGLINKLDNE
jgi:UDP-4-amino-4,6-dideoxy-N-acetyl-beta-L-altrosamine N-acetyltransferase